MFLDSGSQVSFLSTAPVKAIGAPRVGSAKVSPSKGFGSGAFPTEPDICALTMVDKDGREHTYTIHALQHDDLGLDFDANFTSNCTA